jgi:hypothetical protein
VFPQAVVDFYSTNQELLWLTTLLLDLGGTILLYRLFGKAGLQVAIATAIILANLQGPKLTVIFGMQTSRLTSSPKTTARRKRARPSGWASRSASSCCS